jgi:hypothetical protein
VFREHGEHGTNASIIARHMVDTYFAKKEGRPLPPYPTKDGKPGAVAVQAQPGDTDVPVADPPVDMSAPAMAQPAPPPVQSGPAQRAPAAPATPPPPPPVPGRRAAAGEQR